MELSKTTVAGSTAAALLAAADLPGNPHWLQVGCTMGAAVAIAILGKHAAECPANCPGTTELGHPRPWQRPLLTPLLICCSVAASCLILGGCTSPNPKASPANPTEPAYIVNPQLAAASNSAALIANDIGPMTGTGPSLPLAVNAVFGLVGALSLMWARHKSATTTAMATGIAQAGPAAVQTVLRSASDGPKYAAVAEAINLQTGAGTAPGQTVPPKPNN